MNVSNTVANARTWIGSFAGPCAWLAGFALLLGAFMGGWVAWHIQDGRVARAELNLANFEKTQATQSDAIKSGVIKTITDDRDALRERDQAITAAVDAMPAKVIAAVDAKFKQLGSKLDAPQFNCIRTVPLPADFLRALEQPAGSAFTAGSDQGSDIR